MQIGPFHGRAEGSRVPMARRLSRNVLKRCSETVLRDRETLGELLRDPRTLHLIVHDYRLTQEVLLDPVAIARVVQEPNFLVTLADSEHLLDYLRRHQHLLNCLLDDYELIAMIARDPRFMEHLLRDQTSLTTLLDDQRTLDLFARSNSRMVRLARGNQQLREALLSVPESLDWIARDDRVLRSMLDQPVTLDRILQSDRARARIRASRDFLDQLVDDPGFIAELFLDSKIVRKLLNNRMLLRGILQDESIQTAFLECMPTTPTAPLPDSPARGIQPESDAQVSLADLLRSPEIAITFSQDDDLLGCLLENAELCRRIAEHPILLRTLAQMDEPSGPAETPDRVTTIDRSDPHANPESAQDGEGFVFSFQADEATRARRELARYWNEFLPFLAPTHTAFLTRFQHALNQLESRDQISDTLVQILIDDGEVHLRGGSFRLLAGSKLPDLLYQVLVAGRYRFDANTDTPRILDCGAQAGLATYGFKLQYPNARITAVEPAPNLRQIARANLEAAGHNDIEHLAYALATERGSLPFVLSEGGNHGGALAEIGSRISSTGKTLSVLGLRLSDLLRDPVDYLKLDVAGAEVDILIDAEPELANVKQLFVEVHDGADDFQEGLARLFSVLKRSGFATRVVPPVGPSRLCCDGVASSSPRACEVFGVSARRID